MRGFSSRVDLNRLATIRVEKQLADGSWQQARDPALSSGDINATVLNYAALKFCLTSISATNVRPAMEAAMRFILAAGGIDATNQFTKTFLALFGLRGWGETSEIPYLIFLEALPLNYRQFSQWVIPHLIPMAYLRHNRVPRKIRGTFGPELDLNELYAGPIWRAKEKETDPSAWYDGFMVKKILRQPFSHHSGSDQAELGVCRSVVFQPRKGELPGLPDGWWRLGHHSVGSGAGPSRGGEIASGSCRRESV